MNYRREIDGLRAVAVVPVILFHAGFPLFGGGYVGVDVFFVISGYLITTILISDLAAGRFSILRFYERRARRILPALFVVMLACLPFAWAWMMPGQLRDFGQSLVAVVFFGSNILFWLESGYFAVDAELKPLLHTWSLAVEEQYYVIFPVLLLGLWRMGRGAVVWSIVGLAVLSFALSEWTLRHAPDANFYLLPTRAWELLVGSLCALVLAKRDVRGHDGLAALGLGALGLSIFTFEATTPFPGAYALLPVLGTALLILFCRQGTWVARLLSLPACVGIGLISYSAYLWHQPLFAFARIRSLDEPGHLLMGGLSLLSLVLAWASWRWIEQPFRRRSAPLLSTQRSVFLASGAVASLFLGLGLAAYGAKGFEGRPIATSMARFAPMIDYNRNRPCLSTRPDPEHPVAACLHLSGSAQPEVLLVGDSHGDAMSAGVGAALTARGIPFYETYRAACLPIRSLARFDLPDPDICPAFAEAAFDYAEFAGISTVVLSGRFPLQLHGSRFDNGEGGIEKGSPALTDLHTIDPVRPDDPARPARVLAAMEGEIRALAARFTVVLVYPVPEAGWHVADRATKMVYFAGQPPEVTTDYTLYKARTAEIRALFDRLVAELPTVVAAPIAEAFCSEETGRCVHAQADAIFYRDDDHLGPAGAARVAPIVARAVEAALAGR